jgi:hypothetical protein
VIVRAGRPVRLVAVALLPVTVLLGGCTSGGRQVGAGGPLTPGLPVPAETTAAVDRDAAVPLDGRDAAEVDVVSGATTVTVRAAELGPDLLRASVPVGASAAPVLDVVGDTVRVRMVGTGGAGPADVTVVLARGLRWRVRLSGGATAELVDLRGTRPAGIDLAAGADRIEVVLPVPTGAVVVRMAGGASAFTVRVPPGVATGVRVGGGAGTVVVDGVRRTGLPGATTVTTAAASDRYEIEATAGVGMLTVDRG